MTFRIGGGDRGPLVLLAIYALVWTVTAISPRHRQDWLLENLLVLALVPLILLGYRRRRLSTASYAMITAFLVLHAIGAHYTYSEVPLGDWLREAWSLRRNHYDRVVHLAFGLLLARPTAELLVIVGAVRARAGAVISIHVIAAWSGAFEVVEMLVAHLAEPALGAAYTGAQGDAWDAQKDMALALVGAITWALAARLISRRPRAARP